MVPPVYGGRRSGGYPDAPGRELLWKTTAHPDAARYDGPMPPTGIATGSPNASVYDLGYRHYEGRRFGRLYAAWSLYAESLRSIWGFGRPVSAKAAPFILAGLYALPALIVLALSTMISQSIARGETNPADLPDYANYFGGAGTLVILFLVAQAPEVVCRDQRYQVLPLYLTRGLGRLEYAFTRLASLSTALFLVLLAPVVVLFIGDILMSVDAFEAIGKEVPKALPAIPSSLLIALYLGAIAVALSSFSPRRAYSAIGGLAYFMLMNLVPMQIYDVGHGAGATWVDFLPLLTPNRALSRANDWFFGTPIPAGFPHSIGPDAYVVACLTGTLLFTGVLFWRYRRIAV
jgi:ABC-2 type transport system permease protein